MTDKNADPLKKDTYGEMLAAILNSVNSLREDVKQLEGVKATVLEIQDKLHEHTASDEEKYARAFPDGDLDGHRRAHAAQIRKAEEQAEFWRKMRIKAGEMTVWAFLVCVAAILAYYWNGHMPSSAHINVPGAK